MQLKQEISNKFIFLTADATKQGSDRRPGLPLFSLWETVNLVELESSDRGTGYTNWTSR